MFREIYAALGVQPKDAHVSNSAELSSSLEEECEALQAIYDSSFEALSPRNWRIILPAALKMAASVEVIIPADCQYPVGELPVFLLRSFVLACLTRVHTRYILACQKRFFFFFFF